MGIVVDKDVPQIRTFEFKDAPCNVPLMVVSCHSNQHLKNHDIVVVLQNKSFKRYALINHAQALHSPTYLLVLAHPVDKKLAVKFVS